jgi:hypothetical protein
MLWPNFAFINRWNNIGVLPLKLSVPRFDKLSDHEVKQLLSTLKQVLK